MDFRKHVQVERSIKFLGLTFKFFSQPPSNWPSLPLISPFLHPVVQPWDYPPFPKPPHAPRLSPTPGLCTLLSAWHALACLAISYISCSFLEIQLEPPPLGKPSRNYVTFLWCFQDFVPLILLQFLPNVLFIIGYFCPPPPHLAQLSLELLGDKNDLRPV